jgi:hypothetical protein
MQWFSGSRARPRVRISLIAFAILRESGHVSRPRMTEAEAVGVLSGMVDMCT